VIFTAVYQVPSGDSGQNTPLLILIINAIFGTNSEGQETPTPNAIETQVAQTLTAIAPTLIIAPTAIVITAIQEAQPTRTPEIIIITATTSDLATTVPTAISTITSIPLTPFCAFLTTAQIGLLQQVQDAATAIRQAEEFAGYRQNNYRVGDRIP
jgi:hypothetical protein